MTMAINKKTEEETPGEEEIEMIEVDDSGKPVVVPDKDVAEELEDKDSAEDDDDLGIDEPDDDDDDERIGHAEGEQDEAHDRKAERKRQRRARVIRQRSASDAKDRMLQVLGKELLNLREEVGALKGRNVQYDVNTLEARLVQVKQQQQDAKSAMAGLVKAQDGEGVAEVTEIQIQLREQFQQTTEMLRRARAAAQKTTPRPQARDDDGGGPDDDAASAGPSISDKVRDNAMAWAKANPWYNPKKGGEDVAVVKAIDDAMFKEGYNPASADYWTELSKRVQRRLPEHFTSASSRKANGHNAGQRPVAGGPRMAGSSQTNGQRPLGKNQVYISPERKKAMQEAGKWDDPKKRAAQLASYARYDKENAARNPR